ncbi:MAG: hypothetical protein ACK4S4_12670 [Pyrinomonadaceae bacterium]
MADYKERFEKWQKETREKFEEIDKQLGLKNKIGESAKAVAETAQKGAEKIKAEAEKSEIGKQAVRAAEETIKTAGETAKKAWDAAEPIRDAAAEAGKVAGETIVDAGKKAGDILGDAKDMVGKSADRVSRAFSFGAGWARSVDAAVKSVRKASDWVIENPVGAAATGASMALGAGLGVVFTGISTHWLFNSAIPTWSVKKLGDQFNAYLKTREELIAKGELSEAETERVRFERDMAKRIGAPLLGAFSFASGAVMLTNVLNPKTVTGAPIEWLLGGNPMLEGAWFFGNGVVCLKTSYDFFMIALEGQDDVERMVREIKGLLPSGF